MENNYKIQRRNTRLQEFTDRLLQLFPNRVVYDLQGVDEKLYLYIKGFAFRCGTTLMQLITKLGFTYIRKKPKVRTTEEILENFKKRLQQIAVNGNIVTGLRVKDSSLMNMICQYAKKNNSTIEQVCNECGFEYYSLQEYYDLYPDEYLAKMCNEIFEDLIVSYPDRQVVAPSTKYPTLNDKIIRYCNLANITKEELYRQLNFCYVSRQQNAFNKYKIELDAMYGEGNPAIDLYNTNHTLYNRMFKAAQRHNISLEDLCLAVGHEYVPTWGKVPTSINAERQ